MQSILTICTPRRDILEGTFNPEIFTASLSQVIDFYRGKPGIIHSLYTDGRQFFQDATYPTDNLKLIFADVFRRLAGDNAAPAIHRLETAFGGGKTHILIGLSHLGFKGAELASAVTEIIGPEILPEPGSIHVVGIAGEELPVHKPMGRALLPYTMWGEIAFQIGGERLYRQVETEANSHAAPGKEFFETVFRGRKVLILLDELAQYAARLQAARPDGGANLAAFLMSLHGYARTHAGLAIVLTLASAADAFAKETEKLRVLITKVKGEEVDDEQAWEIAQQAEKDLRSVVARDATTLVPIQAAEISRILAKRLFEDIDYQGAAEIADAYLQMYQTHAAVLPDRASHHAFRDILVAHYPFHPTFINFLNAKMATIETFQSTRGVLRVLALVTRSLWQKKIKAPMIHASHIPLTDARTVDEILGRTGGGDLLPVLNADIGGPDSSILAPGQSYAQMADQKNPHPLGLPLYEYTWKTVFLHSLVGRSEGLGSNLFGITEPETIFAVACPGLTPPQIRIALDKIEDLDEGALYLRFHHGRYYASLEPSVNLTLNTIRRSLTRDQVDELIKTTARKVVTSAQGTFQVAHDVSLPEHIPDNDKKPFLAMVALDADQVNVEDFFISVGVNRPRHHQNLVFLLVPQTVRAEGELWTEDRLARAQDMVNRLEGLARTILAMRKLRTQPENYGISTAKLHEYDFDRKMKEREVGLLTTATQAYDSLWYPSATRQIVRREIKAGAGEAGLAIVEEISQTLINEGELLTAELAATHERLLALKNLFFETSETPSLTNLRADFTQKRHWPVLVDAAIFDQLIRAGIQRGVWAMFRLATSESVSPEDFYSRDTEPVPFDVDLTDSGWSLISLAGANKRGWGPAVVDKEKVKEVIHKIVEADEALGVTQLLTKVVDSYGEVSEAAVLDELKSLVQTGKMAMYHGNTAQSQKPSDLLCGRGAPLIHVDKTHIVATPATVAKRGWLEAPPKAFTLSGTEGAKRLWPLLAKLGSFYSRGATSTIRSLDLVDLEISRGGRLRLILEDVPPEGMKALDELFEVLAHVAEIGAATEADLEIAEPDDTCLLVKELKKM
ncbi:MAG: ATP-binding protein [Deltaproteobacteria bacterium]|nr:ATP-binding protein [Deltaproteobacteria bacterium]